METARPRSLMCLLALVVLSFVGSLVGCDSEGFRLSALVEFRNRTGFPVEVRTGNVVKISRLPNGGIAEFETSAGNRVLTFRDLDSGLVILEEVFRLDSDHANLIVIENARAVLAVVNQSSCCLQVIVDGRLVGEVTQTSTRDLLIPAGSRDIELRQCGGNAVRSETRILLSGGRLELVVAADGCI